ncbi:ribonuclease P protein subunit [Candidatus Woesearchaeota archaeon]|nr:ribonuclease P protein subunit [Candidatus Woesearchaeota archaeon]
MKQKQIIGKLIGKFIKVTNAKNKTLVNLQGRIIDETRNTITIQTDKKQVKLIKSQVKIKNEN